ncbi:Imm1 family immunity protein [Solwaraspora sp. WMMD1047]|uniref:Imm1 family immunity protein n=1 Tax=Solwaraspora sp. WMMD1047 TaxID=3016102 RepID=UPI002416D1A2|nr:Imm1 family immunity protein [Solwaraspora sp. WMMD1047]MDG4834113.1 Imm1 family immunity protein [Solwaraspora sp. WMMD1047]
MSGAWRLYWGADNTAQATSTDDIDAVLDRIAAAGAYIVDVTAAGDDDAGVQIGVGHPDRATVLIFDDDGGYAYQPELPAWPEPIDFDYGGQSTSYPPSRTRITPANARHTIRTYLTTGNAPTPIHLDQET